MVIKYDGNDKQLGLCLGDLEAGALQLIFFSTSRIQCDWKLLMFENVKRMIKGI